MYNFLSYFQKWDRSKGHFSTENSGHVRVNPSIANFHPKHKDVKIYENHLNPVMLVFIR